MFVPGQPMQFLAPGSQEFALALQTLIASTDERIHITQYLRGFWQKRFKGIKVPWLDVGNAAGSMNPIYLEMADELTVVEPNEYLHQLAKTTYGSNPRVELILGDAETLSLPGRKFKIATLVFVEHHFVSPARVIAQQIMPMMESGGYIVVVNNASKSPAHNLHLRLGYTGTGLDELQELIYIPGVDRIERKILMDPIPRWHMKSPDDVYTVCRFLAGDHKDRYAFATEEGFEAAVSDIFLPRALEKDGLANPHEVVTIKLR